MQGIAQKILAAPERYSVDMLRRAVETGLLPAYVGIPLIQAKMQAQQQGQQFASLGQPSPDQQPTVAEQVMGQGGVDSLPTNLPQEYATGGIVAFQNNLDQPVDEHMPARWGADVVPSGVTQRQFTAAANTLPPQAPVTPVSNAMAQASILLRSAEDQLKRMGATDRRNRPEELKALTKQRDEAKAILSSASAAPAVTPAAATAAPAPAAASAPRTQGPSVAPRAVTPPPAPGITGLPAAEKPPELVRPAGPTATESARELFGKAREEAEGISRDTETRIREARGLMQGEAFQDYKKQLEDEARRSGADRADAKNMALFKAGLAMMAGTSRHALENIGKGAMVGVEDFQTAARELRKADKDRQKEFALIDQARRAEKAGNIKEEVQLLQRAEDRRLKGLESLTTAISAATGADRAESAQFALQNYAQRSQTYRTNIEQAGALQRTREQIAGSRENTLIGARATLGAAQLRGTRPDIPASVRARISSDVENMRPDIEGQVLKSLGITKPPPPTNAEALREFQQRVQAALQQQYNNKLAQIAGVEAPGGAGQAANPFEGFSLER